MNGETCVIIPAHNAHVTIDETLRSSRAQLYRALEIIVVDHGSRGQAAAIAACCRSDPTIKEPSTKDIASLLGDLGHG